MAEDLVDRAAEPTPDAGRALRPGAVSSAEPPRTLRILHHRVTLSRSRTVLISTLSIVSGIVLWQLIGEFVVKNPLFLATPLQTITGLRNMWDSGALKLDLEVSGEELLFGFLIGSAAGILIGALIAKNRIAKVIATPFVSGFNATPIIALAPIVILWFGIGIWSKVIVVISLVIFPQIISTEAGIRTTEETLRDVGRSFGGSEIQIFKKIEMWWSLPYILAGLRLGIGRAIIGVVVGELFGAKAGLGLAIFNAQSEFNTPELFAGVTIFAVSGIVFTYLLTLLERWLTPWALNRV